MSGEERARGLVESVQWDNGASRLAAAVEWTEEHSEEVRAIRGSQWEALRRAGEGTTTLLEFYRSIRKFLRGAAARDKAGHSWGKAGLVPGLLGAMVNASKPDSGPAESELRQAIRKLAPASQIAVRRRMRLEACRQFIGFLAMKVRVQRSKDGNTDND